MPDYESPSELQRKYGCCGCGGCLLPVLSVVAVLLYLLPRIF